MDELSFRYKIARLIAEDVSGIISVENKVVLDEWLTTSDKNQKEYEQIIDRLKTELPGREKLDVEQEWEIFKQQIKPETLKLKWWYSAAAAVLVGAVALFLYVKTPTETPKTANVAPKEILKERKAILVLGDGRRMNISGDEDTTLIAANGLHISTSGNRLEYQKEEDQLKEDKVQYNTLIIPRGAEYELRLSDGTIAWLNSSSSLTYPVNFDGDLRKVQMKGEVCFNVTKREHQPFVVTTGNVSVRVLGTLFNMQAYKGEPITTTLVRGKVEVSDGKIKRTIEPNQQAIISSGQFEVKQVDAEEFIGWTNGIFNFTNTPLDIILDRLSRWYDVEVIYESPSAREAKFSLEVKRPDNISNILSKIEKTGRVRFEVQGRTVIVKE